MPTLLARYQARKIRREMLSGLCMLVAGVLILVGMWVGYSHFEAATYNKLTGASVTTWDAMWVRLRVQSPPTEDVRQMIMGIVGLALEEHERDGN